MDTKALGDRGEKEAWKYLRRQGYRMVQGNYSCPGGEIDIIVRDKTTLVFVEVRSKSSAQYGTPAETVDSKKQQRLRKAAEHYLYSIGDGECYCRFDVVAIIWQKTGKPIIEHYRDAF